MANRDYGERGRGWERDDEDRYGRGGPYGRGYYGGGTTGEENWGQWGASRGYAEPSGRAWERGRWSSEGAYRGRYVGERAGGGYYGREPYVFPHDHKAFLQEATCRHSTHDTDGWC
jgi:hypothetical protein